MWRSCATPGCARKAKARGMCSTCYERCRRHGGWTTPLPPDPSDKAAYLATLSRGELVAYCTGVLSRAAITPGDPHEVAAWMELVRAVGRGGAQ